MTDIAFVGLGEMGTAMATRLVDAGHTVRVWNRSQDAVDRLVSVGASAASDIEDAFSTGVVFSILANDAAVDAVFTDAVLASAPPSAIHVNMATLSVAATERQATAHARAGIEYIAAPVLGRSTVAAAGKLNIVAAGAAAAIARVQEYLDILGKQTFIVGDQPQMASLVKIGVNFNLIHTLQALAESVTLIEKGGVDPEQFVSILTDAAYTGSAYVGYGGAIARRSYDPPGFTVALGLKDLSLAESAAEAHGVVLPSAPTLRDMFERTLAREDLAPLDWAAIAEITRDLADRPIESN